MHVLNPQLRPLLAVLESRLASVHDADLVEVRPEGAVIGPVAVADQLDEVRLQEILAVFDGRVFQVEVLNGVGNGVRGALLRLARNEGLGRDVKGEQVRIDGIQDGGDCRRHYILGCLDRGPISVGEIEERFEVGDAGREVAQRRGVDALNLAVGGHHGGCTTVSFGMRGLKVKKDLAP